MVEVVGRVLAAAVTRRISFGVVPGTPDQYYQGGNDEAYTEPVKLLPFVVNFYREPVNGDPAVSIKSRGKVVTIKRKDSCEDGSLSITGVDFFGDSKICPTYAVEAIIAWVEMREPT